MCLKSSAGIEPNASLAWYFKMKTTKDLFKYDFEFGTYYKRGSCQGCLCS